MKVFHIDSEKTFRGGQRQVLYLLEGLSKRGVGNFLFCPGKSPLFERAEKVRKIPVPMLCEFDIFSAYKIAKFINRENPDILHCHSAHALSTGLIARKLASRKPSLIASRRVIFPIRCRKKYISTDKIIAISEAVKKTLEAAEISSSKIDVVYSGIKIRKSAADAAVFARKQLGIREDIVTVAVIGALTKEKRHDVVIRAASEVLRGGVKIKVIMAGSGDMEKKLKQYAAEKGMADSVLFAGFRKDILELFPAFDMVVNASESEGLGTSVLDAMASGCAVIASGVGGIPEIIEDSVNGFLFKAGDDADLAGKIIRLASDAALRKTFADEGKKTAEKFSAGKTAEGTLAVYREVLNERNSGNTD